MSEETIMKFKLATLFNILLGVVSIGVIFIGMWVGNIGSMVSTHDRDIATLKECTKNQTNSLHRIEALLEEVRKDQLRRERGK